MEKQIAELKSLITKLTVEISKIKLDAADTRIYLKSTMGNLNTLSAQVQNLDAQIEAGHKKAEGQAKKQKASEAVRQMSMTEITELYKKDPVAARKAMEAKGLKIGTETATNPWLFKDVSEQKRIRSIDPELADRLESEAAGHYAAQVR